MPSTFARPSSRGPALPGDTPCGALARLQSVEPAIRGPLLPRHATAPRRSRSCLSTPRRARNANWRSSDHPSCSGCWARCSGSAGRIAVAGRDLLAWPKAWILFWSRSRSARDRAMAASRLRFRSASPPRRTVRMCDWPRSWSRLDIRAPMRSKPLANDSPAARACAASQAMPVFSRLSNEGQYASPLAAIQVRSRPSEAKPETALATIHSRPSQRRVPSEVKPDSTPRSSPAPRERMRRALASVRFRRASASRSRTSRFRRCLTASEDSERWRSNHCRC